jgi:hypothetical protein
MFCWPSRKKVYERAELSESQEELVSSYLAGAKVKDLAVRHRINRSGVRRHYPALLPEEVTEAARLYRSRKSLLDVGDHFGAQASTSRTYPLNAGIEMRDRHGKKR